MEETVMALLLLFQDVRREVGQANTSRGGAPMVKGVKSTHGSVTLKQSGHLYINNTFMINIVQVELT